MPTLVLPDCVPTPTEYIPSEPQWAADAPAITPAPAVNDPSNPAAAATECWSQSLCLDAIKSCGEGDKRYGA